MKSTNCTRINAVRYGGLLATTCLLLLMMACGGAASQSIPSPTATPTATPTPTPTATPTATATPSSSPTATPVLAPTITGFQPTAGPVGTPVVITGSNLSTTTAVAFNGVAAVFSIGSATQITATVPAGAASGAISVTTPGGSAVAGRTFNVTTGQVTLDLSINGMYVTQASQDYPNPSVPLVQNRSAWVRVFVVANQSNTVSPDVEVDFVNGSATNTLTIHAPSNAVPLSADPNTNTSWDASVPAGWVQPGTQVTATIDPANNIAEADKTNNEASEAPNVVTLPTWKVTLIPIQTGDGRTGVLNRNGRTPSDWVDFARRLYPVPDAVDAVAGTSMVSSANSLSDKGAGWNTVLTELRAKQVADGVTDRYYFGVVSVSYTSGVAGLGYISVPAAIGWDYSSGPSVLAHEEGHNFGRQHSPCGNPDSPDQNYPYAGGLIGVPGWDVFAASSNLKTDDYTDIMGYCSKQWISDYTYNGVLHFRQNNGFDVVSSDVLNGGGEGLLVWGEIDNDRITMEPAFRVPLRAATRIEPGPYVWEARDAAGQVLATVSFGTEELADLPGRTIRSFAFIAPVDPAKIAAVNTLRILKDSRELAQTRTVAGPQVFRQGTTPATVEDLPSRKAQISWNTARYPMLMLKDAKTGEVRGFLRGGSASIEDVPDQMEVHLSDGVHSQVIVHQRTQP